MHADRFDNQAAFDLLAHPEHQRLLYGALKAAHVTKYHPQFEDCVTVAHLTWLAAYQNYEPELPANLADFRKFAFRRIKWRTVDYLRNQTCGHNRRSSWNTPCPSPLTRWLIKRSIGN